MIYGDSFCSQRCADDWFEKFGQRAVDHFGRIHEPIKLTQDNAWRKLQRYWNPRDLNNFYWYNGLTEQELPLTEENAWYKYRDWRGDDNNRYYFANQLSEQQIPITEAQYHDENLVRP